jgi:hypothetical protein
MGATDFAEYDEAGKVFDSRVADRQRAIRNAPSPVEQLPDQAERVHLIVMLAGGEA